MSAERKTVLLAAGVGAAVGALASLASCYFLCRNGCGAGAGGKCGGKDKKKDKFKAGKWGKHRDIVSSDAAPEAIGPYSQATRVGSKLYVSGQIGMDRKTKALVGPGIEEQTVKTLENVQAVVEAGGSSLANVVQVTILLSSMDHFAKVNEIYSKFFPVDPPARATFAVAGLPKNALIEVVCIAFVPHKEDAQEQTLLKQQVTKVSV